MAISGQLTPRVHPNRDWNPGGAPGKPFAEDGAILIEWDWKLDCTPSVLLKVPDYVSEKVVKQIEGIRG